MAVQIEEINYVADVPVKGGKKNSPLLLPLILLLPILLIAVGSRQILRQRAAPPPQLANFKLSVDRGLKARGENFLVNIEIRSSQEEAAMAAGVTMKFNPDVLEISQLVCGEKWPQTAKAEVDNDKIEFACFKAQGNEYSKIQPGEVAILGDFLVKVKEGAVLGTSRIAFSRLNLPDKSTGENHGGDGEMSSFMVTDGACELKIEGDADCNGIINIADFALWRKEFTQYLKEGGVTGEGWQSDFDLNGVVNVADFSVWLEGLMARKSNN